MKHDAREIRRRLRAEVAPPPPPELLERLKADVPGDLGGERPAAEEPAPAGRRPWRLRLAASLFLVVAGGLVAYRVLERVPAPAAREDGKAVAPGEALTTPDSAQDTDPTRKPERVEGPRLGQGLQWAPESEQKQKLGKDQESERGQQREAGPPGESALRSEAAARENEAARTTQKAYSYSRAAPAPPTTPAEGGEDQRVELRDAPVPRAKKVPIPDPTPGAALESSPEHWEAPGQVQPAPAERRRERLHRLGEGRAALQRRRDPEGAPEAVRVDPSYRPLPLPKPLPPGPPLPGQPPSTGGTAEPNDQPYGDMFFRSYGVNPFIDVEDDPLSTFGLEVDTGSYTVARSYLERGHLPPPEAVRVEEFLNFFDYGDPPPAEGDFAIRAEGAPTPFGEGERYYLLRFGLRGRQVAAADRRPAVLTFVVDVSGSMDREDRLELVKRALGLLLDQLGPEDRIGLVVYGTRGQVLLEPTGDRWAVRRAIERLTPGGSTNAEEGLVLGYRLARDHYRRGAVNRLILCSDGVANVGRTGAGSILDRVATEASAGIELTAVGFGMGNYNDVLLEQLADRGDGRYAYVDTLAEARRVFVEDLTGTLETIAADAKAQVEFDPQAVSRYRLLGYENRDVADERFRDDTVDAGEIGAGHQVTALYEVKLNDGVRRNDRLATLRLRYRSTAAGEVLETARELRFGDLAPTWERATPALRLASLVAELAELLRGSYWAREGSLDDVFHRAQRLVPEFPGNADVAELASLAGKAARLRAAAGSE